MNRRPIVLTALVLGLAAPSASAREIGAAPGPFRTETMQASFRFCPARDATLEQAMPVLLAFVDADPTMLEYDIRDVASLAFRRAWPCQ